MSFCFPVSFQTTTLHRTIKEAMKKYILLYQNIINIFLHSVLNILCPVFKYFAYKPPFARTDNDNLMNKYGFLRHTYDPREQDFCLEIIISPVEVNATSLPAPYNLPWTPAVAVMASLQCAHRDDEPAVAHPAHSCIYCHFTLVSSDIGCKRELVSVIVFGLCNHRKF